MKLLHISKLFFTLLIFLTFFLIVNNTLAIDTSYSINNSTNLTSSNKITPAIANTNNSAITSSKIISQELTTPTNTPDDFFVKIGDEVIPIDYTIFSSKETTVKYAPDPEYYPEIENINLCPDDKFNIFTICNKTISLHNRLKIQKKTIFIIEETKLAEYLKILNNTSKRLAKNVVLTADTNGVISVLKKETYGHELNMSKILMAPLKYFSASPKEETTSLPVETVAPIITSTNYKELGLQGRIGTGKSNFRGSPKNRIHNIHNATSKFEGIIIAPNKIFSFVENLGDVDESTGYKEELVIKDNKTIPEFGGGICQVSTTLFRSAVNTGLEITERRNHAYKVSYYSPQGTDATIYIPKPDLEFKNNTSKYIMLQPHIEGTILTFDIFGTSDGRQVETEGPTLLERKDNGDSKYVWWQIVNDKDGKQISKKGFWSYYQNAAKFHSNHQEQKLTSKPKNWSGKQWKQYKREHHTQ